MKLVESVVAFKIIKYLVEFTSTIVCDRRRAIVEGGSAAVVGDKTTGTVADESVLIGRRCRCHPSPAAAAVVAGCGGNAAVACRLPGEPKHETQYPNLGGDGK